MIRKVKELEIWKVIEEFPDYEISSYGNVRRCKEADNKYKKGEIGKQQFGENNIKAKLTKQDVIEIRRLLKEEELTQGEIAKRFKVKPCTISKISCKERWDCVEDL